jgi:hypothetical protein
VIGIFDSFPDTVKGKKKKGEKKRGKKKKGSVIKYINHLLLLTLIFVLNSGISWGNFLIFHKKYF